MATITQTMPTTAIELPNLHDGTGERQRNQISHTEPEAVADEVMQQSLLADSEVPDGGYGWVLISACAVVTWWFVGVSYTWGVMQAELVEKKGYSSSTLAFVGSLCPACISLLAVPNARLIRLIGARITACLGIFLLGLGSILSGFATDSIAGLFMTWGFVGGLGTSLCFMVSRLSRVSTFHHHFVLVYLPHYLSRSSLSHQHNTSKPNGVSPMV
jgi:hypothetical protein